MVRLARSDQPTEHEHRVPRRDAKHHRIYLRNSTLKRVGVHLQETRRMASCPKQKRQRVNSLLGLMGHYATYRIRKRLLQPESAEWGWMGCFDRNLLKLCQKKT
ncbi:hypothetical protein [Bacteroides helcogenes]|uniref:Uncharacterized protein n=1 Tax=Bacteroides helcogenes (strain ATCC 35417 / DSM 20613 / JCM 6297 / CCUG 15421 / P 36-108) TaxID=693979 RepID=E6SNJ8_BACT6|nr:hypothetical protein [Bacteroides helcogenes]ADV43747.1 hypothetical protein Bache_1762 [Bacteroides helcogenes P 36-108]MDY5237380.1 hypothetical protein [Bacteroides helcogenes]